MTTQTIKWLGKLGQLSGLHKNRSENEKSVTTQTVHQSAETTRRYDLDSYLNWLGVLTVLLQLLLIALIFVFCRWAIMWFGHYYWTGVANGLPSFPFFVP